MFLNFVITYENVLIGEALQLQWELSRRDHERDQLTTELAVLTAKVEEQSISLNKLSNLQKRYDALLQLYGEKLEESEELKLDLQDVKDMYKAQVNKYKIICDLFMLFNL